MIFRENTSVVVLSQMQEREVTIEISSPVENVVVEQRTTAEDTTRPQLPSRLITCSQTMLGDQELFLPIVQLQDLEHDSKMGTFYLKRAKYSFRLASQPRPHSPEPGRRRQQQGTSSGRDSCLKKFLASL